MNSLSTKSPGSKRPTLNDVAQLAGVSLMSASIALRSQPGKQKLSELTRRRILQAASHLKYQPHPSARSLASSRTHQIGYYLNEVSGFEGWEPPKKRVLKSAQSNLWKRGYRLGLYFFDVTKKEEGFSQFLVPNRFVDGIVTAGRTLSQEEIDEIRSSGMPVVSIGKIIEGFFSLMIDEYQAGIAAADYLHGMGHREIAVLSLQPKHPEWNGRVNGFLKRARDLGMRMPASRCIMLEPVDEERGDPRIYGRGLAEASGLAGRRLYQTFLDRKEKVTALYVPSDYTAFPIVQMMDQAGVRLGEDLSLLSYDNLEGQQFMPWETPRLTSFDPPFEELGEEVASILGTPEEITGPPTKLFTPRLVERGSVKKLS